MTCCLLKKAKTEWGTYPGKAVGTLRIFLQILCAFLRDTGIHIFQAPKHRRKSAENLCKNLRQNLRIKSLRIQKSAQKSAHQKSAPKKLVCTFRLSGRWKPEKNTKEICATLVQNPSPNTSLAVVIFFLSQEEVAYKSQLFPRDPDILKTVCVVNFRLKPLLVGRFGSQNFPNCIVKNHPHMNTHLLGGFSSCFGPFLFFCYLSFLPRDSSSLPLFQSS